MWDDRNAISRQRKSQYRILRAAPATALRVGLVEPIVWAINEERLHNYLVLDRWLARRQERICTLLDLSPRNTSHSKGIATRWAVRFVVPFIEKPIRAWQSLTYEADQPLYLLCSTSPMIHQCSDI